MPETDHMTSVALYRYLCQYIVGIEEHVMTLRLVNNINDRIGSSKYCAIITSGSVGEGIEMEGSDLDMMYVIKDFRVCETASSINYPNNYFTMDTEDTKPGFTKLRLKNTTNLLQLSWCINFGNKCDLYLSNVIFKKAFFHRVAQCVHGPCLSNNDQTLDVAICLHSKSWIHQARQWVTRSNNSWPDEAVKQTIIDHGVLFVPVGVKGSPNEEVEWRISFSVGEKFLIYTFSHTQLMCYVLMKILLKDVIATDDRCKELLCSYYLKTILFWVSEEISPLEWIPHNLIGCFMLCVERLIYCVKYSLCPHYFIPENNLFENKIEGSSNRKILLENLNALHNYGWRCILFSKQFSVFPFSSLKGKLSEEKKMLNYGSFKYGNTLYGQVLSDESYEKAVRIILSFQSLNMKYPCDIVVSRVCGILSQSVQINNAVSNKHQYKQYRTSLSYLLQDMKTNAVTRWFLLSSLFYRMKQYKKALYILSYTLSKCTPEKLHCSPELSDLQCNLLELNIFRNENEFRLRQILQLENIFFTIKSTLIPDELEIEVVDIAHFIPPVIYGHFLGFLCFYHLGSEKQCVESVIKILFTSEERYFVEDMFELAPSLNCAGIALQLLGDHDMARQFYMAAIDCESPFICAKQRLDTLSETR